jgi:hypothetical protein
MAKIEMIIKKKFGRNSATFVVSADNFHEAVLESAKLSFGDMDKCGECGKDNLSLSAHKTKEEGYVFAYVKCNDCRATLNFGQQKKDTSVVYYRMKEDEKGERILVNGKPQLDWRKPEPKEKK